MWIKLLTESITQVNEGINFKEMTKGSQASKEGRLAGWMEGRKARGMVGWMDRWMG